MYNDKNLPMRRALFQFFKGYFAKEISWVCDEYHQLCKTQEKIRATHVNYPIGRKIIFVPNEPGDMLIGTVAAYHEINSQLFLMVRSENTGELRLIFDNPAYWTPEREAALRKLSWHERYNASTKYHSISISDSERKELITSQVQL